MVGILYLQMEKEDNYQASFNHYHQEEEEEEHEQRNQEMLISGNHNNNVIPNNGLMIEYMMNMNNNQNHQQQLQQQQQLSFADVMQFADLGPKLALNQVKISENDHQSGMIDPVHFLKFPVLNDMVSSSHNSHQLYGSTSGEFIAETRVSDDDDDNNNNNNNNNALELQFLGDHHPNEEDNNNAIVPPLEGGGKSTTTTTKRKRPRTLKTTEEVESQRMTHIAVERNRRKQMNEHLRVLRSLMPGSYVQRGDQASIIGGAIEFVRELEQLLQCLESQKRRRLYGEAAPTLPTQAMQQNQMLGQPNVNPTTLEVPLMFAATSEVEEDHEQQQMKMLEFREEMAENRSCLADIEVKLLGFDAMVKILSRRRPGQLVKTIAALEDLQFNILHTNITTIEQTVLYSFNLKIAGESRLTAEDIASSVQQIIGFIHANTTGNI